MAFELEHCKRVSRSQMYGQDIQQRRWFSIPSRTNGTVALSLVKMIRPTTTTISTFQRVQFRLQTMSFLRMLLYQHLLNLCRTRCQILWTFTLNPYLPLLQFQLQVPFLRMRSHQHQHLLYLCRTRNQILWTLTYSCRLTVLQFRLQLLFLRIRLHQPLLCLQCTKGQRRRNFCQ